MTGFRATNVVIVLVVLTAAGIAAWQLARVVSAAQSISDRAANISQSGRGINIATDSVVQLSRTNRTAGSILDSARPLEGELSGVVSEAKGIDQVAGAIDRTARDIDTTAGAIDSRAGEIDATAGAIDSTAGRIDATAGQIDTTAGAILGTAGDINAIAGDINSTAGDIRTTAGDIDGEAVGILREAVQIDRDVFLINFFLNGSIDVAELIDSDLDKVLDLGIAAHDTAACIDEAVGGSEDGDCRDLPSNGDFGPDNGRQEEGTAPLGRRGGPGPMGDDR